MNEGVSVSCALSWTPFLLFVCFVVFVLSYYYFLETHCFIMRARRAWIQMEGEGEELEGVEEGETITKILYKKTVSVRGTEKKKTLL